MEKIDARKLSTDAQQQLRYQVIRLRKQGRNITKSVPLPVLAVPPAAHGGPFTKTAAKKPLKSKSEDARLGSCRTLSPEQEKIFQKNMRDKCPDQLKLPFALWTRIAVKQLIKQLWAIDMPIRTVGEYLKRWGFTPQKPLSRAYEQNPKAVKAWLNRDISGNPEKGQKRRCRNSLG